MGQISVKRITNANIYLNGTSLLGQAEEVTAPGPKYTLAEHKALGMVGKVEFFAGIDKLEGKIKWNSFYKDQLPNFANPFTVLNLQVRGSIETYTSQGRTEEKPVVIYMTAQVKNFPDANFKQHENVEAETTFGATYYKMTIDGTDIVEFDAMANIFKINGTDVLAQYRSNIGG